MIQHLLAHIEWRRSSTDERKDDKLMAPEASVHALHRAKTIAVPSQSVPASSRSNLSSAAAGNTTEIYVRIV